MSQTLAHPPVLAGFLGHQEAAGATRVGTGTETGTAAGAAALLTRARTLCASGRVEAVRPLLAAARRLGGPNDEADLIEATLLLRCDRADAAIVLLDAALARDVPSPHLRLLRARARLLADDAVGAARDAAAAVLVEPGHSGATATLGIALGELGRLDASAACLAEAVSAEPVHPGYRLALARTLELAGEPADAVSVLDEGIARAPDSLPLRNAAVRLAINSGEFARAASLCQAARAVGVLDACLVGMHGHALSCLGDHTGAADAYEQALQLAPEDTYVRHLVAASGRRPAAPRAPDDYVRVVFDGYASRFDGHLVALGYRVPGLLRAAALAHAAPPLGHLAAPGTSNQVLLGPVLDLGCGTGLMALAMSDLPLGPWVGVDLSGPMLREAAQKGLYAALRQGALPEVLEAATFPAPRSDFALAVAGDMLCYVGALEPLLAATRERLRPGGLLLASLETAPGLDGWALRPSGRYAHGARYVRGAAAAAGLEVLELRADWLRAEHGQPVAGLIVVLARPGPPTGARA